MENREQRLQEKAVELRRLLGEDAPPIMGVLVKRSVRVVRGRLLEVRQRVILEEPPLGGGAAPK